MAEPKLGEKNWEPAFEAELYKKWEAEGLHDFDDRAKSIFVIDTPPVYPSGEWHIGAVAAYTLIDMAARARRMAGDSVLFPFCLDRNGINIELVVEKKHNKRLHDFDREEFIELCKKEIAPYSESIISTSKRIGMSGDYEKNYYETDSDEYRAFTQATFIELFKNGFVYEDLRPSFYCPACKTTIAEAEIYYKEQPTNLNYVKWKVKETGDEITIATTRPELTAACQAVLFHPDDARYKKLEGKNAIVPIYNHSVPIIAHNAAKPEFGTGVLMVCSYGDTTDIQLFRELKLKPIAAIGADGRMTEAAGKYSGLKIAEAQKKIIEDLKAEGLLVKQENTIHRTPVCERSNTALEFISMKEWYLKQLDFIEKVKKNAGKMSFHPERSSQTLYDWINGLTIDWPVSRRRYYHTEIPIWYCKKCNKAHVPEPGKYYQPWKEKAPFKKCGCGGTEFIGDDRVFDTWMDSSISNLYVCKYLRDPKFFEKTFPCSFRPQGRDIIRTWLYYATLKSTLHFDKPPFRHVMIHGMGLDEHGKKMSKSLGNAIKPDAMLDKHGTEAFRFWAASEANLGEDFRISEQRIRGTSKFLTKLWNVAKFVSSFEGKKKLPEKPEPTDEWILAELNKLIGDCRKGYDQYNFFIPSTKIRDFVWNVFASSYIEMAKTRAYAGDESALYTMHTCLRTILELLAPITPFITDKIYRDVYGETVHRKKMPAADKTKESKLNELTTALTDFNSNIWKQKKDKGLSLKDEFKAEVPKELEPFAKDLKAMHKLV